MIAASLLQRGGLANVLNVSGGMDAWKATHLPTVYGSVDVTASAAD
jgi:rhodanese-related sulfurtransferase